VQLWIIDIYGPLMEVGRRKADKWMNVSSLFTKTWLIVVAPAVLCAVSMCASKETERSFIYLSLILHVSLILWLSSAVHYRCVPFHALIAFICSIHNVYYRQMRAYAWNRIHLLYVDVDHTYELYALVCQSKGVYEYMQINV